MKNLNFAVHVMVFWLTVMMRLLVHEYFMAIIKREGNI